MSLCVIRCKIFLHKNRSCNRFDLGFFFQSIYLLKYKHNVLFHRMDYMFIHGSHEGNRLLYIKTEKRLYVEKCKRNENRIFICYQTVLLKRKKVKYICQCILFSKNNRKISYQLVSGVDTTKCTARVTLHSNGILSSNIIPHTAHRDHECHFSDLNVKKNIMNKCRLAKELFPDSANKISSQFIFNRELSM